MSEPEVESKAEPPNPFHALITPGGTRVPCACPREGDHPSAPGYADRRTRVR